jgi:LmbE family N-acetylglucosaminyl deacetylase
MAPQTENQKTYLFFPSQISQILLTAPRKEKPVYQTAIRRLLTAPRYSSPYRIDTTGLLKNQMAALREHKSQFPAGSKALKDTETYLRLRAFDFGLRSHHGTAEGFRILGAQHLHVLSEFGQ